MRQLKPLGELRLPTLSPTSPPDTKHAVGYAGYRLGSSTVQTLPLYARVLGEQDASAIHGLHHLCRQPLAPDMVRPDTVEFFRQACSPEQGVVLGLETAQGQLISYGVLTLPPAKTGHYSESLRLAESELGKLAILDGSAVHPDWRGNGLQHLLIDWRIQWAACLQRIHICATAAPQNYPSWRSLCRSGLYIYNLSHFYGGMTRYVLYRNLHRHKVVTYRLRNVPITDLDTQQQLLDVGWIGIACRELRGTLHLQLGQHGLN